MTRVAFISFIYPGVERYLSDFSNAIACQTYSNFDLVVFNDGVAEPEKYFSNINGPVIFQDVTGSPAEIRNFAISEMKKRGYSTIIFGDSDDYFSENRVAISLELLKEVDIVVNDLNLVSEDKKEIDSLYISNRVDDLSSIELSFIKDKNIFGLSNTAVNLLKAPDVQICADLEVVDWFYFTVLLAHGLKARFTNKCQTYYRQHSNNTVGMSQPSNESLERTKRVKRKHYYELGRVSENYEELQKLFSRDVELLSSNSKYPLWWE